jgi:hypothetical protein
LAVAVADADVSMYSTDAIIATAGNPAAAVEADIDVDRLLTYARYLIYI